MWPECTTVDVSEGGAFVEITGHSLGVGDVITIQVASMEDAPLVTAQVMRLAPDGIGVAFAPEPEEWEEAGQEAAGEDPVPVQ